MFAFFNVLHTNLGVAMRKRESFDATTDREAISAQDIDFRGVAIDKDSDEDSEEVVSDSATDFGDTLSESSRTMSGASIERDMSFDDERNDEAKKVEDEIIDFEICKENETIVFGFFA